MMELAEWSKSNYAMSLVGKTVTASRFNVSGGLDTTVGLVDRISFVDNEYVLFIEDKRYTLSQIMEVHATQAESTAANKATESDKEKKTLDASGLKIEAAESTADAAVVYWKAPTDDSSLAGLLRYTVYISTDGPFNTLEAVKRATPVPPMNRSDTVVTIPGLKPDTEYYVNVVVNDATGAESLYQPVKITTKAVESTIPVGPLDEEDELEEEDLEIDEILEVDDIPETDEEPGVGDDLTADGPMGLDVSAEPEETQEG
jgi:hypothetical protein